MKKVICHNHANEEFEVEASKLKFRPSVYGILIEDDKVLLSRQWDGYDFPGGGIELDETIEEALKREFFEETGLQVEPLQVIDCHTSFFHPGLWEKLKDEYWNCPLIYYFVKKVGGELSTANFDEEEKEYADMAELISINQLSGLKFYNGPGDGSIDLIKKALRFKDSLDL